MRELKPCPFCGLNVTTITTCAQLGDCDHFKNCNYNNVGCVVCDVTLTAGTVQAVDIVGLVMKL